MLELTRIVRAEKLDAAAQLRFAQALLVREARAAVFLHHPLVETQPGRAARFPGIHLLVIEIRVGRVEEPAVTSLDRDARVAVEAKPADRKSTRLNSSHSQISYAVFCLKKKKKKKKTIKQ